MKNVIGVFVLCALVSAPVFAHATASRMPSVIKPTALCTKTISAAGVSVQVKVPCKNEPLPPTPTASLNVDDDSIVSGESTLLTWSSTDATTCTASGGWTGTKNTVGSESVSPAVSTTYTLACSGSGGTATSSVSVTVTQPPPPPPPLPTVLLTVDDDSIVSGESALLSWSSTNASSCLASEGWSGTTGTSGTQSVSPTTTTTYTLACSGLGGQATSSVTVSVAPVPPPPPTPTVTIAALPTDILSGATSTLTWSSTDTTTCTASDGWTGSRSVNGNEIVSPSVTTTYTIACSGDGGTATSSAVVNVTTPPPPNPTPTLSFDATSLNVLVGATTTLSWTSANATLCEASGGWSGSKSLSGNEDVIMSATTTYSLACGNGSATSTKSVTVNAIVPPPPSPTLDHLLISEVKYEGVAATEWVELYNGTGSDVVMEGWTISDSVTSDTLATTTIPTGTYVFISGSSTLPTLLGVPATALVITLSNSTIGSGLNDGGDSVTIRNHDGDVVDAMSYGTDVTVFNPAVAVASSGNSLMRATLTSDTDTANDWQQGSPTPGL